MCIYTKGESMTKTVLITGASSGIGLAIANHMVDAGYQVIGTSRCTEKQDERFEMMSLDVCDEDSVRQCVNAVLSKYGKVDVLVNNAGVAEVGSAEETTMSQLSQQFDTNFFGMVRMIQSVLPSMRSQSQGQIINISSLVGFAAIPYTSAYSASKFALEGYSEALYHELLPLGIHVSVVQPGMVKTGLFKENAGIKNVIQDYTPWYLAVTKEIASHSEKGISTSVVADKVLSLCQMEKPPFVNRVGPDAKLVSRLRRFMPKSIFNRIWHKEFGMSGVKSFSQT